MATAPRIGIPPLAGVCTLEEAASGGLSVDENVRRLLRYAWAEKCAVEALIAWLNPTPEWEAKCAFSLHVWQDADHADQVRKRVKEMRHPMPRTDVPPDDALDAFCQEMLRAENTVERLVGLYGVLKPALAAAYRQHLCETNPLFDYPTTRVLRFILTEEEEQIAWGEAAVKAITGSPEDAEAAKAWTAHLNAYLAAAGGIAGTEERSTAPLPAPRATGDFEPDLTPRRDARFVNQWNFVFPPHEVAREEGVGAEEKTLALMCKRALEMDVPEMMAGIVARTPGQPWDFYRDMARQIWDECRHSMMGEVFFESRGIDWTRIPLHPGFSLQTNLHCDPREAHAILYTIEQNLMPADTGKKYEWVTAQAAHDPLATFFQDYDWADEVLHTQIGRRWLKPFGYDVKDAMALSNAAHARSWPARDLYTNPALQTNWWPDFVEQVLNRPSDSRQDQYADDPVITGKHRAKATSETS
jgi:hypothetical protein